MATTLYVLVDLDARPLDVLARTARIMAVREEADQDGHLEIRYERRDHGPNEVALLVEGPAVAVADLLARLADRGYLGFFAHAGTDADRAVLMERAEHLDLTVGHPTDPPPA